eukprot:c25544_g1_i2 orf=538-2043(-)
MGKPKKLVRRDIMRIQRESVIMTMKPNLVMGLANLLVSNSDTDEFLKLCKRIEATIRAWYHLQFEDFMQLHSLFDPVHGTKNIEQQNLTSSKLDVLEQRFLQLLFQIMEKSNYKILSDEEAEIATSGQYLLNLPIAVDTSKLDSKLFTKFFKECPKAGLPKFANQYVIFRRGIGLDHTTGYFIMEKVNAFLSQFWGWLLTHLRNRLRRPVVERQMDSRANSDRKANENVVEMLSGDTDSSDGHNQLYVERVHIQDMELRFQKCFSKITIQEPTFERMILVYREAESLKFSAQHGNRAIHIKHFRNIPMADMELVLPEKRNPSLTPMDWTKLLISAGLGLATLVTSLEMPKADLWVALAIFSGVVGYCVKIFLTFQQNLVEYQNLLTRSMYDKQIDSGKGTLLHLCDDVIQQEVKEVILAYFVLMTQGKATEEDLDARCEEILEDEFGEKCDFEVHDAVVKLEKLGIVTRDSLGRYCHRELNSANEIIGVTTEELVGKVLLK